MCDGFNHAALQLAVAQICQSMGWDALQKSSHDLLTDVLQNYLEEIAKAAHGYCQQYCRTEPNLDDLNQAFQDVGVFLHELEDFVSQVDQVPFIHQLPRYPKPKASVLHHPRNGEIVERLEQYYDYLPPLVSKLLQNEDEEKAAAEATAGAATTPEDTDAIDAGQEREGSDRFIRKEIKTIGEETHNEPVAVKRPLESPPALDNDAKKRRVELPPFMQKGNRGNEMDILHALQGNLSSPSPTPSPDAWTEKTFEIPPPIPPTVVAYSSEKPKSKVAPKAVASLRSAEKKPAAADKPAGKPPAAKAKASPKKKAKPVKAASSPAKKPTVSVKSTPPKLPKDKSPALSKSPLTSNKKSVPQEKEPKPKKESAKKTTAKKGKKPAAKATKTKKPPTKSPAVKPSLETVKENIVAKESMPKLIIKPIKQEVSKEPQFAVSELLPVEPTEGKAKSSQPKKTKSKQGPSAKAAKASKPKEGIHLKMKVEPKESSTSSGSVALKFSIADFAVVPQNAPPVDSSVPLNAAGDVMFEHKKKKKKRKEKDKDKEKKKDKSKKLKTDHGESSQSTSFSSPPIPRIKVKLEPPSSYPSLTEEPTNKLEASLMKHGTAGGGRTGTASFSSPVAEKAQPVFSSPSAAQEPKSVPVPKVTVKKEPPERTVISQTVSTTFVHGYSKEYYCPVCGDADDGTFMIGCDGCDEWFHGRCVGIIDDPGLADWFCSSCLARKDKDKLKKKKKKKSKDKGK